MRMRCRVLVELVFPGDGADTQVLPVLTRCHDDVANRDLLTKTQEDASIRRIASWRLSWFQLPENCFQFILSDSREIRRSVPSNGDNPQVFEVIIECVIAQKPNGGHDVECARI